MDFTVQSVNSGTQLTILTGPTLSQFLTSVLKGGSGMVEFTVQSGRVRGSSCKITVEVYIAAPEDGSGLRFNCTGSYQGRSFKGYYNANPEPPNFGTGVLTFD